MSLNGEDNNERRMKQKYLKEQISANRWNPEDFAVYLEECQQGGKIKRDKHRQLGV